MNKYEELFLTTTDTITGIGAPVSKKNADAIYELKGRRIAKPLIIMVSSIEEARKLKGWDENAEKYAEKFWPGEATLVLNEKIAVRQPNLSGLLELLRTKGPCYMTSANISGEEVYSLEKAKEVFYEIDEVYNFGEGSGLASKIIDVRTGKALR